jgi:amino acid transporter/mannitol/fructose-specific phosphotransferase system IIA component (Ntr-type)
MELKKGISFIGVFSIASGAMISSGIFILPGLAFAKVGPPLFISYFLAGFLGLIGIFSVIELATAMPKAGGDYFFVNKTFGPFLGTVSGFLGWFALSLKSAFAIFGIAEIILLYTGLSPLISGLILTIFFVWLNIIGVKESVTFQIIMVIGLLTLIALYVIFGLPQVNMSNFKPFLNGNFNQILITAGFVFVSFGGLLNVANISEEVKNPKRNIPLGIIASVVVVGIFYTLITFVITGTLTANSFSSSLTPVADSAKIIMGNWGYFIILIASTLAFFTTANAGIMSASRYPLALSRDNLISPKMSQVNQKFKTPVIAIIFTGLIIYLSLLLPIEMLVKAASTVILTAYVLTNFAVIILRESQLSTYKPSFKAPYYPWLQIFCIILFTFFIIDLGAEAIEISLALLFISFLIYMFYGRKSRNRESALLHLIKIIADKKLMNNTLEDELRDILIHRDNIEQDNFDTLIKQAQIFDINHHLNFPELLPIITPKIADKNEISASELNRLCQARKDEFNPAISQFLAIPHIVIPGENKMFLAVVRAAKGIKFTEKENDVKAVFLLGGTKDKRVLHLKTLASIATLVGQKDFQEQWLQAAGASELKNLMLLNRRKRFH